MSLKDSAIKLSDEDAKVNEDEEHDKKENKKSKLNFIKGMLPKYFDSEWSFARFKVPGEDASTKQTCGFT